MAEAKLGEEEGGVHGIMELVYLVVMGGHEEGWDWQLYTEGYTHTHLQIFPTAAPAVCAGAYDSVVEGSKRRMGMVYLYCLYWRPSAPPVQCFAWL